MPKLKKKLKKIFNNKVMTVLVSTLAGAGVGATLGMTLGGGATTGAITGALSSCQASLQKPTPSVCLGYSSQIHNETKEKVTPTIDVHRYEPLLSHTHCPPPLFATKKSHVEVSLLNCKQCKIYQLFTTLTPLEKTISTEVYTQFKPALHHFLTSKRWPKLQFKETPSEPMPVWKLSLQTNVVDLSGKEVALRDFLTRVQTVDQWMLEPFSEVDNRVFVASVLSKCAREEYQEAAEQSVLWGLWGVAGSYFPKLTQKVAILFSLLAADELH